MENKELSQVIQSQSSSTNQFIEGYSSWVTASATVVLACLTLALVFATMRMAIAMAPRPHVVANLESNQWANFMLDLVIENCGNAPAYDVSVKITPPIESSTLSNISVIRPGQSLVSFATDWGEVQDEIFHLEIKWKSRPKGSKTETLSYQLNMGNLNGISHIGILNPMIQVANEIKKIRDDWLPVANGQRRTKIDVFDQDNRNEERRLRDEYRAAATAKKAPETE